MLVLVQLQELADSHGLCHCGSSTGGKFDGLSSLSRSIGFRGKC